MKLVIKKKNVKWLTLVGTVIVGVILGELLFLADIVELPSVDGGVKVETEYRPIVLIPHKGLLGR